MAARLKPIVIGAVAGVLLFVAPGGLAPLILVVAALLAGWALPGEPMTAAALFLVPTIVVGAVRVLTDDDAPAIGVLVMGLVVTLLIVGVLTHVGAGIALRRQQT